MMQLLGVMQFVVICTICIYEFKMRSPMVFMWATLFIMFGLMHLLTSLTGDYQFSNGVMCEASAFAILFSILYLVTRIALSGSVSRKTKKFFQYDKMTRSLEEDKGSSRSVFVCLVAVMALKLIPFIMFSGGLFSTSWSSGRDYTASMGYLNSSQIVNIAFYSLSGAPAFLWLSRSKKLSILSAVLLSFGVIVTRNRIEVLPILCSFVFVYLLHTTRIKARTIVWTACAGVMVIYIVYGLRVFRHYGTVEVFLKEASLSDFIGRINSYIVTGNGELGLRRDMYYFLAHNNKFVNFGKAHSYIRMLLVYIPTSFSLGLKPPDFAISMGAAIGMAAGGSTHPTLFGDCYANLGFWGIFLGVFWAIYATIADKTISVGKKSVFKIFKYTLIAVTNVIIGRGSIYNGFWLAAYGIPALMLFEYLSTHLKIRARVVLGNRDGVR